MSRCLQGSTGLLLVMTLALAASVGLVRAAGDTDLSGVQREFEQGNYGTAINILRGTVSSSPKDAAAFYWLGRCYYEIGDYDNAVKEAERSTSLEPQNSVYHQWLGRAYGGKADRDHSFFLARRVRKEFEQAVQLDPKNIQARRDLEDFYLQAPWIVGGSKDRALQQANAIAALDSVEGHLALADYWDELGNEDRAEAEYEQALTQKPKRVEPYLEAADFYRKRKNVSAMEGAIEDAAAVNPSDPRLAYYRGVARVVENKNLSEAEEYLKSYLASTPQRSDWPSHAAARVWLGQVYEKEGKRMEAAEQYRAALQLDPGRQDAKERLERLEKSLH